MKTDTCYGRKLRGQFYGVVGTRARLVFHDWHDGAPRFRCTPCDHRVGARAGTADAGMRTEARLCQDGAAHLAEGSSIRATGRRRSLDKDPVGHGLPRVGEPSNRGMSYFFRDLPLSECQLDDLWPFIYPKEDPLTPLDELLGIDGAAWVWMAFSPVGKLGPAWVVGKRTFPHARKLVFRLKSATAGPLPFFPRAEWPHYAAARLEVYGVWATPPRQGNRGRYSLPRKDPPPDLCYAVVVKERERGRVGNVTTRMVYGPEPQVSAALKASPGRTPIHPYGVARNNLTIRPHSRRRGRKVKAFSQERDDLEHPRTLAFAY